MSTFGSDNDLLARTFSASPILKSTSTKILVIYAGGTIGMQNHRILGYSPKPDFLFECLQRNPMYHDTYYKAPKNIDHSGNYPRRLSRLKGPLNMPQSIYGKRISYHILEYAPLLDSSNMTIDDWVKIAGDIEMYYHDFDAFVVLHGTDTMSYTASALSFMLENLGKSVILTGSQIPLSELRNDANMNLLGALTIAGHYVIPEVTLFFSNKLFRGNRAVKTNLADFEAFDSPNMVPLAKVGINIDIDWGMIWRSPEVKPFKARKQMNPNVTCLRIFPGITEATVRAVLAPCVQGVVLETFGAGNAPDNRPDLLEALKSACDRGVVIVNISQCRTGIVSDIYATGKALSRAGVVAGLDMTTECALTKLAYLLADETLASEGVRERMGTNLRGELTKPIYRETFQPAASTSALAQLYDQLLFTLSMQHQFDALLASHFFHLAASQNDVLAMNSVLQHGGIIDDPDYLGMTPLMVAVHCGCLEATQWLLQQGASVHIKDDRGRTALGHALHSLTSESEQHKRVVDLLHEAGAV